MDLRYNVIAPFAGIIERIYVKQGESVELGAVLFALQAEGITHHIVAPVGGEAEQLEVSAGDSVIAGMFLTHIKEQ
ncbi:biotin/lipoyl-containing protein [Paenibacillus gansuensis]|uniref:Biotin/lipoyl-containing protein n=1 Tax=Paenibacillus gansuensis TaxID=306542 RepID=A0ABW5P973_9BACL